MAERRLFPLDNQLSDNPLIWFDRNNFILMLEEKLNENKNVLLPERKLEKNKCNEVLFLYCLTEKSRNTLSKFSKAIICSVLDGFDSAVINF